MRAEEKENGASKYLLTKYLMRHLEECRVSGDKEGHLAWMIQENSRSEMVSFSVGQLEVFLDVQLVQLVQQTTLHQLIWIISTFGQWK